MRVEFIVANTGKVWSVRRGVTTPLMYDSRERAIAAAEKFARTAAEAGEMAVVKIAEEGALREHRSFAAERFEQGSPTPIETRDLRSKPPRDSYGEW